MKIYNFIHEQMSDAHMSIGSNARGWPDKSDLTMIRVEDSRCFKVAVRLLDERGAWHNFGEVEGFELCFLGGDERWAFINLMKNLIAQDEADKAKVELDREVVDYGEEGEPSVLYNNLAYCGLDVEDDKQVLHRLWRPDAWLPEGEE